MAITEVKKKKTKSFKDKQRDKRIQKQVENLGGPKQPPKPKTLKKAAQEQLNRATAYTSGGPKNVDRKGFKPLDSDEKYEANLFGYGGLYKKNVPKELRDRMRLEKNTGDKDKMMGGGMVKPKKMMGGGKVKGYTGGGKVRGCGMARKGTRPVKMVMMKGSG
jgi:hypothetical protein